ncbi:MAG: DUF72 domain-containing protein, partial [Polaromonas sp.]
MTPQPGKPGKPGFDVPSVEAPADRRIRVGVGGWTYEPWRNNFFPAGLPHSRELGYAGR